MSRRIQFKVIALVLVLAIVISLSACSIPGRKPEGGIWYCEKLMIEIDFDLYQEHNTCHCAKKYNPDGSYQNVECLFDYGSLIVIRAEDEDEDYENEDYLTGNFRYRNGVFYVTTIQDKVTYVFERIDMAPSSSQMVVRHLDAA